MDNLEKKSPTKSEIAQLEAVGFHYWGYSKDFLNYAFMAFIGTDAAYNFGDDSPEMRIVFFRDGKWMFKNSKFTSVQKLITFMKEQDESKEI